MWQSVRRIFDTFIKEGEGKIGKFNGGFIWGENESNRWEREVDK